VSLFGLQVLSMSRLGGAAAVAPLVADMSSEVIIVQLLFHFHSLSDNNPPKISHSRKLVLS